MNAAAWLTPPLTRRRLAWALVALLVTALPFFNDVPFWILGLIVITCAWRYFAMVRGQRPPHALFRFVWTLANFALVWVFYGTISGLEAGTALLLVMAAMKLTETGRTRDLIVIVYMSLFLIVAHALFEQSLPATFYAFFSVFVALTALTQISRRAATSTPAPALKSAATLGLQALPILLILFLLFPRVPGPFWALPNRAAAATGLSDSMEPGSISQLLRSSSVAFRVQFESAPPPSAQLYWRGPVFANIEDGKWSPATYTYNDVELAVAGEPVHYTITIEPHFQRWLFALDAPSPADLPGAGRLQNDMQVLAVTPIAERRRFRMSSHPDYILSRSEPGRERARYLNVSQTSNPRTKALARQWRNEGLGDAALVRRALSHFNQEPFSYTLNPPLLARNGGSASDEFLFRTRRGFCEHYASSFTLLMRYAGIPARVVTGYQGGEFNSFTEHLTVRQSDAHAWSEVWLPGRGWQRVDPTGAVAPERVETGISAALGNGESLSPLILGSGALLSRLRHSWDAINAVWNDRVLGYGKEAQLNLLRKLGIDRPDFTKLVAFLSVGMIAFLVALTGLLAWRNRPRPRDPLVRLYARFCTRLGKRGVVRSLHEGPRDFARRAAKALPALATDINDIADLFIAERYGPSSDPVRRLQLKKKIRTLASSRSGSLR